MPAIVDHEQRRREISSIAADLIAKSGPDAPTIRALAASAGFSTKLITHYFPNKREILLATYRHTAEAHKKRFTDAVEQHSKSDTMALVKAMLPTTAEQRKVWLVSFCFWAHAITDKEFAQEQRKLMAGARARIAECMSRDPRFRHLSSEGRQAAAKDVFAQVMGVAMQSMFDKKGWPPQTQAEALETHLNFYADQP